MQLIWTRKIHYLGPEPEVHKIINEGIYLPYNVGGGVFENAKTIVKDPAGHKGKGFILCTRDIETVSSTGTHGTHWMLSTIRLARAPLTLQNNDKIPPHLTLKIGSVHIWSTDEHLTINTIKHN